MGLAKPSLLVLGVVLMSAGASAQQDDKWKQDFKAMVPPVMPLPPNSQLNPGNVGGTQAPYTTAPLLQSPTQPTQPAAPGLKLSIPSR